MYDIMERIEINPKVMLGKPVIQGTRITVEMILKKLSQHIAVDEILRDYPRLIEEDIKAAIAFASESLATDEMFVLAGGKH